MGTNRFIAAVVGTAFAATACSGGSTAVQVQQSPPAPPVAASSQAGSNPAAPTTSASARPAATSTATQSGTSAAPASMASTSTPAATPTRAHAHQTSPTATAAPTHTPTAIRSSTSAAACSGTGATHTMKLTDPYRFSPSTLTVARCDTVRAVYADATGVPHTWHGPTWNSGALTSTGQAYSYRFTSTGTFSFYCDYHQSLGMTGTITVH